MRVHLGPGRWLYIGMLCVGAFALGWRMLSVPVGAHASAVVALPRAHVAHEATPSGRHSGAPCRATCCHCLALQRGTEPL